MFLAFIWTTLLPPKRCLVIYLKQTEPGGRSNPWSFCQRFMGQREWWESAAVTTPNQRMMGSGGDEELFRLHKSCQELWVTLGLIRLDETGRRRVRCSRVCFGTACFDVALHHCALVHRGQFVVLQKWIGYQDAINNLTWLNVVRTIKLNRESALLCYNNSVYSSKSLSTGFRSWL